MKRFTLIFFSVWALASALTAQAQSITPIYSFTNGPATPDGTDPYAGLIAETNGVFYGATTYGGANNFGTIFQVTTNGILTVLANFNSTNGANGSVNLTMGPDGNLYGTTAGGDYYGRLGMVFQLTTNGILTILDNFNGTNGIFPNGLTLGPDGNFYGTTEGGGSGGL